MVCVSCCALIEVKPHAIKKVAINRFFIRVFVLVQTNKSFQDEMFQLINENYKWVQFYKSERSFLYRVGVFPVFFLNTVLKAVFELKPDSYAIPSMEK